MVIDTNVHHHLELSQSIINGGLGDGNALVNAVNRREVKVIAWLPTDTDLLSCCGQ